MERLDTVHGYCRLLGNERHHGHLGSEFQFLRRVGSQLVFRSQCPGTQVLYHCTGGRGETVRVWYNIAHTAYTVRNAFKDLCTFKQTFIEPYILSPPNSENAGGGQYCVVGACRHKNANYWDRNGRAGGPDI